MDLFILFTSESRLGRRLVDVYCTPRPSEMCKAGCRGKIPSPRTLVGSFVDEVPEGQNSITSRVFLRRL